MPEIIIATDHREKVIDNCFPDQRPQTDRLNRKIPIIYTTSESTAYRQSQETIPVSPGKLRDCLDIIGKMIDARLNFGVISPKPYMPINAQA